MELSVCDSNSWSCALSIIPEVFKLCSMETGKESPSPEKSILYPFYTLSHQVQFYVEKSLLLKKFKNDFTALQGVGAHGDGAGERGQS